MRLLLLFLVAVFLALPAPYIAAAMPAIWIAQSMVVNERPGLLSIGPVDVNMADLVLLGLCVKMLFSIIRSREVIAHGPLYLALAGYVVVNGFATLLAGVKFGGGPMLHGLTAFARLGSEIALIPILAQTVKSLPQARRCAQIVLITLGVLAAIQFINFFGASHGFVIGEVQGTERGEARYFGPVGDSIGAVLLFGYLCALCFSSVLGAGAFFGGTVLTAGFGAIFSMGIGTALFVLLGARAHALRTFFVRYFWLLPAFGFAAVVAALTMGKPLVQTLIDRLSDGGYAHSATQRMACVTLGGRMFADNPVTGVGFLGYEPALARYGGEEFFNLSHLDGATANANNQILQTLTDAGVPGLLAFAALVICAARLLRGVAAECQDRFLATFFLAAFLYLLAMVFGNLAAVWLLPSSNVARLIWIALGLAVAVAKLEPAPVIPTTEPVALATA